jgi:hypothetical protein
MKITIEIIGGIGREGGALSIVFNRITGRVEVEKITQGFYVKTIDSVKDIQPTGNNCLPNTAKIKHRP